ncbi:hypothetical protein [Amycolatopsis sp. NPDC051372]|uniref:hypothetical protein n=1 Tax=Amycolatopsis sp. NPDC051372 TaxID=3155669 RepID=UPI003434D7DF
MAELKSYVHVSDEDGRHGVFGPGDEVPEWAAARITNPKAWVDGEVPAADADQGGGEGDQVEPPRSGKGSGLDAWTAYAKALGYEVAEGTSRDDIIAAIDAEKE